MKYKQDELDRYMVNHTKPEATILARLRRETNLRVLLPQMMSGPLQGKLLSLFSRMIRPKVILEIGTFTGYSAICLADGLTENGRLHTIEINEELIDMAAEYFELAGIDTIIQHEGHALEIIPTLKETFDLVFIDADKINYGSYYDLIIDRITPGGYIIADNVLWNGKVLDQQMDQDTEAIHQFNEKVLADGRVDNLMLGISDGLMIARKNER